MNRRGVPLAGSRWGGRRGGRRGGAWYGPRPARGTGRTLATREDSPGTGAGGGAGRDLVLLHDGGGWADRLAELFTARGHRVRQAVSPVPHRTIKRLVESPAPGGVVVAADPLALRRLVRRVPPGWRVVVLYRRPRRPGSREHQQVMRWCDAADRFLALTAEEADGWARDGLSNAGTMPDPLPMPNRPAALTEPVVVASGGPDHGDGLDLLLESWAEVSPRYRTWRLWLAGCAAPTYSLRQLADRLGVADTVSFGGCGGDQPVDPLLSASVFALPARGAAYPTSLAAAMARGIPAVAYDCAPGTRELITDGVDGLTVPPGNTRLFATALERLIQDAGVRHELAAGARESVRRFAPEAVAERWDRLFSLLHR